MAEIASPFAVSSAYVVSMSSVSMTIPCTALGRILRLRLRLLGEMPGEERLDTLAVNSVDLRQQRDSLRLW